MNQNIEREIERIIVERDFGGWDAASLARVMRAAEEWEANNERRAQLREKVKNSRYKRRRVRR